MVFKAACCLIAAEGLEYHIIFFFATDIPWHPHPGMKQKLLLKNQNCTGSNWNAGSSIHSR